MVVPNVGYTKVATKEHTPMKRSAWLCSVGLAAFLFANGAMAQAAPPVTGGDGTTPATPPAADPVQATLRTEGGRRVYVATSTIEVRGEIQRPYAFSLSGRSSLGYSYLELPISFLQQIIAVLRRAPF